MDDKNVEENLLSHCSPDGEQGLNSEEAHSFSPSADTESAPTQPPPDPPTPPLYDEALGGENCAPYPEYEDTTPIAPPPPKKKRSGSTVVKVTVLALCVLVLIAASAMLFSGIGDISDSSVSFSFDIGSGSSDSDAAVSDKPYQTYDDFFSAYYNGQTDGVSDMQTVEAEDGMELEIVSAGEETLTLAEIYEKCAPSVVGIKAGVDSAEQYWGTGIIFDENGYIVTNFHIIDGTNTAVVVLSDDSEYDALLVGYDDDSDLAVLKIDAEGLTPAEFGDSAELEVGEDVAAIGNPLGEQFRGTMTRGIISAIDRNVTYNGHTMTLLQSDAAINEGNSGGPLINMYGQVIGITNMKMVSYSSNIEGIGFAIPSRSIKTIVDQLLSRGYATGRPAIGITVGAMPDGIAEEYDIPEGLYIYGVEEGSDAFAQGIQEGDILVAVDGQEVTTNAEVTAIKDEKEVGDTLTLTIYRDGKTFDVDIRLGEKGELFK